MADTIIAKFQSEGLAQLGTEVENTAAKMDLLSKAQNIVNQSTDNLTKKQLELREQISSTGGIVQKMNETGRTSSTLYTELTSNLQKLVVEYQNETKALQDKSTELKKVTLDSSNYAKILTQVANGEVSAREAAKLLKQEFISLKLQGKQNTEQFQQLKQVAGELNDTISDTSAEIKQAGSDTSGLDHVLRVSNSVLAGFGLVQGAVGLFGVENENLQKTLLRVNAAMLLLNSAQQIQEELTKEDSKLKVVAAAAQSLWTWAMEGTTLASKRLRVALLATGIGAIVVGIGLLIANFDKVKQVILNIFPGLNKMGEYFNKFKAIAMGVLGTIIPVLKTYGKILVDLFTLNWGEIKKDFEDGAKDVAKGYYTAFAEEIETQKKKQAISLLQTQIDQNEFDIKVLKAQGKDLGAAMLEFDNAKKKGGKAKLELDLDPNNKEKQQAYKDSIVDIISTEKALSDERKRVADEDKKKREDAEDERKRVADEDKKKREDAEKKALDAQKKKLEDEIAVIKTNLLQVGITNKEKLKLQEDLILKSAELEKLGLSAKKKALIDAQASNEISELEQKNNEAILKSALELVDAKLEIVSKGSADELKLHLKKFEIQQSIEETDIINSTKTAEQKEQALRLVKDKYNKKQLELVRQFGYEGQKLTLEIEQSTIQARLNLVQEGSNQEYDLKVELLKNQAQLEIANANNSIQNEQLKAAKIYEINSKLSSDLAELNRQKQARDVENAQKLVDAEIKQANDRITIASTLGNGLADFSKGIIQNELDMLEQKKNKGIISEKQYQKEVAALKRKQAIADKAQAVFNIGINIAEAITKAMTAGPVIGQVLAGLTAALGFAQLAVVLAKPIPSFFRGVLGLKLGNNPKGRDTIPSMLHEGESVMTSDETSKYYQALKAMRENKFHNLYIPVDRMLKPDLPAAINVGNHVQRLKSVDSDVQVMQLLKVEISGMKEEISYVGEYIKQGNTERVRGNNKLISTIENNKTDGY
mgnify:CR=1 FL=1